MSYHARVPTPRHTLDQLQVLACIARTGSFAAASRELHRVPSAVSYTVHALEEAVGVPLFDRSGHRAGLTAAGRQILAEAQASLAQAARFDQVATHLAGGWEAELQVVIDGAVPMGPVLAAIKALVDEGVPTQVRLDVEYQDGVLHRFAEAQADLMIALGLEDGGRLVGEALAPLPMVLVASRAHPLASAAGLTRADLAAHVDLVVRDSSPAWARSPRPSFLGTRHVVRFSDFQSKLAALREAVGFGWMPRHLVEADLAGGGLVVLDLPGGNEWTYTPQLVRRRDERLGRAAQRVRERVLQGSAQP
ncbi:MAG: LysR family transcriptional regulator [Deltaproteobacteria bacterium]|nr:LysR family transcriptional regulator [Deltaproteobacteria bacterium]